MKITFLYFFISSMALATAECPQKISFLIEDELKCPEDCYVKENLKLHFQVKDTKRGMEVFMDQGGKGIETKDIDPMKCPEHIYQDVHLEEEFVPKQFTCKNKANAWVRVEISSLFTWVTPAEQKKYAKHLMLKFYCMNNVAPNGVAPKK